MGLLDLTATELSAAVKSRSVKVTDAVEAVFERISDQEAELNCYITLDREGALQKAAEVQHKIDRGILRGALAGVPIAVKDNICTRGMLTTCASGMLAEFVPSYSAEAVIRLEEAGAVMIGKTNMDEFGMGSTTETSAFGVTKNPRNRACVPGGSSGGSAAAVAAGECFLALGSDTGGSVRQPAAYCGVVGMKPTYGTVSRYGLVAYASSMDQIGPLTRDVTDCAMVLEVIGQHDRKDAVSIKREDSDYRGALVKDVAGMRIGIPRQYFDVGPDDEIKRSVLAAAGVLKMQGAVLEEFELALTDYVVPAYYMLACAEAASNLSRFDGVKYGHRAKESANLHDMYKKTRSEGFGGEVKRRIMLGSFVLSAGFYEEYYLKALKAKALIKQEFDKAFQRYDILLGPTTVTTAPRLGSSLNDPINMYLGDIYTTAANLSGLPAISVPCGMDSNGLPIGMQLTGDCFEEKKILRAAYTYEQAVGRFTMQGGSCL